MNAKEFQKMSTIRIFLRYFRPHRKLFILDMLCATAVSAVDLAFPMISRKAMYGLLPDRQYAAFFTVIGIVVLAYIIRTLLYYVIAYWGHVFGVRVEADIRNDLYRHMQELSCKFYDQNRTGKLMSRVTSDLFEVTELAHHGPEDLLICILTIVGALIVMFRIEWHLALTVAIILPVLLAVVMLQRGAMSRTSIEVKAKTAAINADIESGLSGIRTAKAFANEQIEQEKFAAANRRYIKARCRFFKAMGRFLCSMEFFVSMLSVAVIGVGGYLIMKDRMDYIDLITFSLYITTFINPVRKLANFAELFANGFAGLNRFAELMRTEPEVQDAPDAEAIGTVQGDINFEDVCFAYDGDLDVLNHVNLHIRAGETVAVVGASGGGKTTLCQLIPRFYDVVSGAVRIDGKDVRQVTQASLHKAVGIVQQDVFLFADTIRENIRYGKPDATEAEVELAAREAEIYEDILQMPDGFDTYVGERGTLLSGGQKQRISIARVFLKNPAILILDEATSALDSVTEARIQTAFDALARGRTTLIIAHRLSTVRNADRIIVIENGEICQSGTHEQLLAQPGIYSNLCRAQKLLI
jgi:ATP-binding cassette subfamily B protein